MSFQMVVEGFEIHEKHLETLKQEAEKLGLKWKDASGNYSTDLEIIGELVDQVPSAINYSRSAKVCKMLSKPKFHQLVVDNDVRYSSISARLGKNGGPLRRNYINAMLQKEYRKKGCMVKATEQPNGDIVLKVAVNG